MTEKQLVINRTGGGRQSNYELLRIVAMFLVLLTHAGIYTLGTPSTEDAVNNTAFTFTRFLLEGVSVVCVNLFVLISGWFGIRVTVKRICSFLFQFLFFAIGINLVLTLLGYRQLSFSLVVESLGLTRSFWFVKAYLLLMLIAPILNCFLENCSKEIIDYFLISFFIFQTLYSWLFDAVSWIDAGQSTISFVGLYVLAGYIRKYKDNWIKHNRLYDICAFGIIIFIISLIPLLTIYKGLPLGTCHMFIFNSPFVIIASVFLFLFFSKLEFQSRWINWISASCFAVYLFHQHPYISRNFFCSQIHYIYDTFTWPIALAYLLAFLLVIFMISIIIDKVRLLVWKFIEPLFIVKSCNSI